LNFEEYAVQVSDIRINKTIKWR